MRLTDCGGHLSRAPFPQTPAPDAPMPKHWLMKSEPNECSIDDLVAAPKQTVPWTGVRNYQARNFMRDAMRIGDDVLFYHSSCPQPGIAGLAEVASTAYPDPTQFDPKSDYHDAKSKPDAPTWLLVDVKLKRKTRLMPLPEIRAAPSLATMRILQRGNRLSITPVSDAEWKAVLRLLDRA
jgi:predicted RNA-binding protein with PUA-like domain